MESTVVGRRDLDDDAFKQRAQARMRPRVRLDMPGIGEDEETAGDALSAFEQRQGMGENVVAILGGKQRQADRHGERRLEVERESGGDGGVEDVAGRRLEVGAVERALFGIEAAPIQHGPGPSNAISPGSSES